MTSKAFARVFAGLFTGLGFVFAFLALVRYPPLTQAEPYIRSAQACWIGAVALFLLSRASK